MSFLSTFNRVLEYYESHYMTRPVSAYVPAEYEPGIIAELSKTGTKFELNTERGSFIIYDVEVIPRKAVPFGRGPILVFNGGKSGKA